MLELPYLSKIEGLEITLKRLLVVERPGVALTKLVVERRGI